MKYKNYLLVAGLIGISVSLFFWIRTMIAYQSVSQPTVQVPPVLYPPPAPASYADHQIAKATKYLQYFPEKPEAYAALAAAYLLKIRETGAPQYSVQAEKAIEQALTRSPELPDALVLKAQLLMNAHEFAQALEIAEKVKARFPDFPDVYGVVADANIELGEYEAAIQAAQTLVNLRPDTASYSRVAHLRRLHGDLEGDIEAMTMALNAANPRNAEEKAWCLVHLGQSLRLTGNQTKGEQLFDQALTSFPDFPQALIAKARARAAQGDVNQAITLLKRALDRVPQAEAAIFLGELYLREGKYEDALRQYQFAEIIQSGGKAVSRCYSRPLVLNWLSRNQHLELALVLTEQERRSRVDIFTCDTAAWCYYRQNQLPEAEHEIKLALRLGTKDPLILFHAAMIAAKLGKTHEARKYLESAIRLDPEFDVLHAKQARFLLQELSVNH